MQGRASQSNADIVLLSIQWRAPEEYLDYPLNEQIDIWSLGNNMYSLLTGRE
jgi:serine/threonine protein kinase